MPIRDLIFALALGGLAVLASQDAAPARPDPACEPALSHSCPAAAGQERTP